MREPPPQESHDTHMGLPCMWLSVLRAWGKLMLRYLR